MSGKVMDLMPATVKLDKSTIPVSSQNLERIKLVVFLYVHAVRLYFKYLCLYPQCS